MEKKYYIYAHINPLKNEIFYIGKGCGKRAFNKTKRSKFWQVIVAKYGLIVDILEKCLTHDEAIEREIWYIKRLGRRDLGLGPLVNLTDGGDGGTFGMIHSNESKNKMSISRSGEGNHMFGKKHKAETVKKISELGQGENHSQFGTKQSQETIDKRLETRGDYRPSDETKNKIGKSNSGINNGWYGKVGPNKGKKQSQETIDKRLETRKLNKNKNK